MNLNFIYNKMIRNIFFLLALILAATVFSPVVMAQNQEDEKTPEEMALEEADRLEKLLALEPHQTFYIDSILQHDMRGMYDEMQLLQMSGTKEYTAFKQVRDKWLSKIDSAYVKVLTEDQWMEYRKISGKLSKEELKTLKSKEKEKKKAAKDAANAKKEEDR